MICMHLLEQLPFAYMSGKRMQTVVAVVADVRGYAIIIDVSGYVFVICMHL